jgi:hypothetical protein
MGIYLNPPVMGFQQSLNSPIYVDKSDLLARLNSCLNNETRFVCVSRPRRFGKTMAHKMAAVARAIDKAHQTVSILDSNKDYLGSAAKPGSLLLVGINYSKKSKKHNCKIEKNRTLDSRNNQARDTWRRCGHLCV